MSWPAATDVRDTVSVNSRAVTCTRAGAGAGWAVRTTVPPAPGAASANGLAVVVPGVPAGVSDEAGAVGATGSVVGVLVVVAGAPAGFFGPAFFLTVQRLT